MLWLRCCGVDIYCFITMLLHIDNRTPFFCKVFLQNERPALRRRCRAVLFRPTETLARCTVRCGVVTPGDLRWWKRTTRSATIFLSRLRCQRWCRPTSKSLIGWRHWSRYCVGRSHRMLLRLVQCTLVDEFEVALLANRKCA